MAKQFNYGFTFQYRESKNSELKTERFFITCSDNNGENACEIAMLKFLTNHGYYSGKLVSWFAC